MTGRIRDFINSRAVFPALLVFGALFFLVFLIVAWSLPSVFSHFGTRDYIMIIPATFDYFPMHFFAMGTGLAAGLAAIWALRKQIDRRYELAFGLLLAGVAPGLLSFSLFHYFQKDELEHIHTIWKMLGGAQPFSDFFQHHHPLLWYQGWPVVKALGPNWSALMGLRLMQFAVLMATLWAAFRIALQLTGSKEVGRVLLLLLLTFKLYIETSLEFRPDVEQVFFCMLGYLFFLKYLDDRQGWRMAASGIFMAIGYLYLQKVVFFLFPLGLVFLYLWMARKMPFRDILIFSLSFAIPALLLFLFYYARGEWKEYLLFNWLVNLYKIPAPHAWSHYSYHLIWNPWFWLASMLGSLFCLLRWKHMSPAMKINFFIGSLLFLTAFLNPRAWKQYYLPGFILLAIPASLFVKEWLDGVRPFKKLSLYWIIAVSAAPVYLIDHYWPENTFQLYGAIEEQRKNLDEYAFDEDIRYNIFQRDMHFFWYSTHEGRMYDAYRQVVEDPKNAWLLERRYDDWDLCRLVDRYRPITIVLRPDSKTSLGECGELRDLYEEVKPLHFKRITGR